MASALIRYFVKDADAEADADADQCKRTLRRFAFGACAFMFKGMRFMPRTVPCTIKTNALKKTCCSVNLENHTSPNIFVFKTCHLYIDTGKNICLGELSVAHKASISSFSFNIICAIVTFQHVEQVFPY